MEYIEIKEQIKQKLPVARDFGDSENLLELGLSSLTIMRLVNQWRKQGVKVSFGSLMENPTFEGWWALIQRSMKKKAGKKRAQESKITPEKDMKQPFPLTDVQYAYWVGRDEEQYLGGIDCHAYLEFDGENIEPERLEKAWNVLQYHHPMLRACFLDDGTQKILDKPYCEKIKVHDFSRMSSEEAEAMAVSVRERLSHRKLKIEEGEVAGIELTLFPENKARLHVDMALLVADVQSLQILLRDLASAYRGENLPKESKGWNFASYLERQKQEEGEERKNAEKYWKNRLEHLPKGPDLPLAKRPQEVEKTVFNRRIVRIEKEEWDHLQMRAKKYQTTPAMVLLTAYATVLERWSRNHRFLINIPFFNRKTEQQGLEDVIADFTTLLLLEIDCEGNPTFAELLDRIQKQLHEDMKYTACAIHVLYDGIDILGCALGGLSTWKLGNVAESYTTSMAGGGNRVISGIIGMVPVTFIVNTNVDRNDIDHPLHLYHRIELTFSTGRLCLVNTHGPVIWLPFLHMPRDEYGTLSINVEEEVNIPSGVTIGNVMLPSVKETFEQIWPDAVKKALEILFKQNRTEKMSMAQYQIYVSKLWSEICQKVGYMNIVDYDNFGDIKNIFYDLEKRHLIKKENDGIE